MEQYALNLSSSRGVFACPCDVADFCLRDASGDDLRVLLYLLRHNTCEANGELCDFLRLEPAQAQKSLEFWAAHDILTRRDDGVPAAQAAAAKEPRPAQKDEPSRPVMEQAVTYSAEEVTALAKQDPGLKFLLEAASEKLGRLLSAADCSALVSLYSYAGMPADVVLMLVEYCVSIGHGNIRYIHKTGLGWADEGVTSHERAEEKIRRLEAARSYAGQIKNAMGITQRKLTRPELEHIARWQDEYHSSVELVTRANEITVERLGKISFAYVNAVLRAWHENGVSDPSQVERLKKERAKNAKGKAPSYDIDEYVRLSMKNLMKD